MYTAAELKLVTDFSPHFADTWAFARAGVEGAAAAGVAARGAAGAVEMAAKAALRGCGLGGTTRT